LALNENSLRLRRDYVKTTGLIIAVIVVFIVVCLLLYFAFLNMGQLKTVDFIWVDHHPTSSSPYVHLEGTVVNLGSSGAHSVQLVTTIYDSGRTLLKTEITDLDDIPTGASKKVSLDIQYSGKVDDCQVTLKWKPFGG